MRVVLGAILAFVAAALPVYAAVVAGALWYVNANRIFDRDGGLSMAIMFALGPLAGLAGGTVAAIVTGVRLSRRQRAHAEVERSPRKPWPRPALIVGSLGAGIVFYFGLWALLSMVGPPRFNSYEKAMAFWLGTVALALAVAGLILWRGMRGRHGARVS